MKVHGESLTIEIAGASVTIPTPTIAELWLEKAMAPSELIPLSLQLARAGDDLGTAIASEDTPAIGSTWHGGVYAGVARGEDGTGDYHVIVMEQHSERIAWQAATDWATSLGDGSLALPSRRELALCFANVPEIFEKTWYWSREQYAGDEAYAWSQDFYYGYQDGTRKGGALRARAVRRLTL